MIICYNFLKSIIVSFLQFISWFIVMDVKISDKNSNLLMVAIRWVILHIFETRFILLLYLKVRVGQDKNYRQSHLSKPLRTSKVRWLQISWVSCAYAYTAYVNIIYLLYKNCTHMFNHIYIYNYAQPLIWIHNIKMYIKISVNVLCKTEVPIYWAGKKNSNSFILCGLIFSMIFISDVKHSARQIFNKFQKFPYQMFV